MWILLPLHCDSTSDGWPGSGNGFQATWAGNSGVPGTKKCQKVSGIVRVSGSLQVGPSPLWLQRLLMPWGGHGQSRVLYIVHGTASCPGLRMVWNPTLFPLPGLLSAWFCSGKDLRLGQDIRECKTHRPHAKATDKRPESGPGAPKWSQPEKGPGLKGAVQVRNAGGTLPGCITGPRQGWGTHICCITFSDF